MTAGAGLLLAAFVMAACADTQETQEAQAPQETQVRVEAFSGTGEAGLVDGDADGTGAAARFDNPTGLAIAGDGTVYVADRNNHLVRAVTPAGQVSTIAGDGTGGFRDGPGPQAQFNRPLDIVIGADGVLVVSEESNHRLRKVFVR